MRVLFSTQPGATQRLGDLLASRLSRQPPWSKFTAAVAFVKRSGVRHLAPHIRGYVALGGQVCFIVGIDHRGTSIEGLNSLLEAVGPGGDIRVFHNETYSTYHPKVYVFEDSSSASIVVGSGNMTQGGLYTNYEAHAEITLDLSLAEDQQVLTDNRNFFDALLGQQDLVRQLTPSFLTELIDSGYIVSEIKSRDDAADDEANSDDGQDRDQEGTARLFRGLLIQGPPPAPVGDIAPVDDTAPVDDVAPVDDIAPEDDVAPVDAQGANGGRGALKWSKILPATDAQRQTGHVTGVVRLSSAGWSDQGTIVRTETYFREQLFGAFPWIIVQDYPEKEEINVPFHVVVLGEDWGVRTLTISHQPRRAAGQSNVTTVLHLGPLTGAIRDANVVGRTLNLYEPPIGENQPFTLEIV